MRRIPQTKIHSRSFCYFLVAILFVTRIVLAFQTASTKTCHNTIHSKFTTKDNAYRLFAETTEENGTQQGVSEAQRLLDQAAQLRAEIAAAEGKTLEEVEQEASQKKQDQLERELVAQKENEEKQKLKPKIKPDDGSRFVQVPVTWDDMVRQAARAVERAFKDGKKTRQVVRFNLISEEDNFAYDEKQWPGGAKQMYRESGGPLTDALLREIRAPTKNKFPEKRNENPTLKKQDVWDFDGTAIHTAEAAEGPSADIQALVFPNTDSKYLEDIDEISNAMGDRLFLLVNPFWRNIESWGFNILAPNAKKRAQEVVFGGNSSDNNKVAFEETYSFMVFSVRGEKCVAIKAYPYDWQLFAFREDDYYPSQEYTIRLGSCEDDPTSAYITSLLNERPEFKETKTMRQMKKLGK